MKMIIAFLLFCHHQAIADNGKYISLDTESKFEMLQKFKSLGDKISAVNYRVRDFKVSKDGVIVDKDKRLLFKKSLDPISKKEENGFLYNKIDVYINDKYLGIIPTYISPSNQVYLYKIKKFIIAQIGHTKVGCNNFVIDTKSEKLHKLDRCGEIVSYQYSENSIKLKGYQNSGCCDTEEYTCEIKSDAKKCVGD